MGVKKILSILIAVALVIGMIAPAFGEGENNGLDENKAKVTKDEAKEIAVKMLKDHFNTEIDEKKFQTRIEFRQDYEDKDSYIWEIDWNLYDNEKSINTHVSVDGNNGKVTGVSKHEYIHGQDQQTIASITEAEAKKIGEDFIKKLNPKEFLETIYKDDNFNRYGYGNRPINYSFRYARMVDGLEFDRNYIMVEVDGVKGTVNSYNYRWYENVEFPTTEGIIDEQRAEEIFKDQVGMNLSYIPYRDETYDYNQGVKQVKLVYQPDYSRGYFLDAKEGVMVDWSGKTREELKIKDLTEKQKENILKKAKPIKSTEKEIDKDRATTVMDQKIKEVFGEGYEIQQVRYMENDNYWQTSGKKAWSAQFRKKDGDGRYDDGEITIDALTEEMISINSYNWSREDGEFEPKLTWDQAYDGAIEAITKYFPEKIMDIKTEQIYTSYPYYVNGKEVQQRYYYFHFPRMENGILYNQDSITLNFDAKTGKMLEVRMMWNEDVSFPDTKGILNQQEAQKIYLDANGPKLVYTMLNAYGNEKKDRDVKVVYRLDAGSYYYPVSYMDAFSGKFLDYNGNEVYGEEDSFKEMIKGHWAEKELTILANQGVIDTKNFDLNKEITTIEAMKILVNAKGYEPYLIRDAKELKFGNFKKDDGNYKILQMAVRYGILENKEMEFDPDGKVSREEMAQMIIKLLQYDKLGKAKDIYVLPFSDGEKVSIDKIGYVALCKGLGIIEGNNGEFRPKDNTTMVEMAAAIYKALGNIKEIRY